MSTVDRGHAAERRVMHILQEEGWFACRPRWAGVDVVALKAGQVPRMIEVKSNRSGGPFSNFRREDRNLLLLAADNAGAEAWLVYCEPKQPIRWIPSEKWPPPKPDDPIAVP